MRHLENVKSYMSYVQQYTKIVKMPSPPWKLILINILNQGSPNQAKWTTSSPWFQWSRPISVKKWSYSRPVSLFKSVFLCSRDYWSGGILFYPVRPSMPPCVHASVHQSRILAPDRRTASDKFPGSPVVFVYLVRLSVKFFCQPLSLRIDKWKFSVN